MKKYADIHCHPFSEYFENPEEIIEDANKKGIQKIFLVGTEVNNSMEASILSKKFSFTYSIIGIHPNDSWKEEDLIKIENIIKKNKKVIGIGEVGLDFHYENSPTKEMQTLMFKKQIELAIKYNLVLMVHSRDAAKETYEILKEYTKKNKDLFVVLHSYSYGKEWLEKFLSIGCYFSYSGIVTFKNAKDMQEAAKLTPLDRIFYETDTPYLTPTPYRGKINLPEYSRFVADFIAELKCISINEFLDKVNKNIEKVFKI